MEEGNFIKYVLTIRIEIQKDTLYQTVTKIDTMYQKAQSATIGDNQYLQQCIK